MNINNLPREDEIQMKHVLAVLAILALITIFVAGCASSEQRGYSVGYVYSNSSVREITLLPIYKISISPISHTPSDQPEIIIDGTQAYYGNVHVDDTNIYEPIVKVVEGRTFNVNPDQHDVAVYAFAGGQYWIQPLYDARIPIGEEPYWLTASHEGAISAIIVKKNYQIPNNCLQLPLVGGINILASATE